MSTWKLSKSWPGYVPLWMQFLFPYRNSLLSFIKMIRQNEMKDRNTDKSPTQPIFSQSSKTQVYAHGAHTCLGSAHWAWPAPLPVHPMPETYHNSLLLTQKQGLKFGHTRALAQWVGICLALTRLWVQLPALQTGKGFPRFSLWK